LKEIRKTSDGYVHQRRGTGRQKRCCQRVGVAREVSCMDVAMKVGPCGKIECTERLINS